MILTEAEKIDEDLPRIKPVLLLLLDGFGIAPANDGNAISLAKTPNILKLTKSYPVALLLAGKGSINARYMSLGCGNNFSDESLKTNNCLASVLSLAGLRQLKISETLRLAALNNFFNGRLDDKFSGEEWKVISSVSRGRELKKSSVFKKIFNELDLELSKSEPFDFIVASIPSIDLSARTGDFEATKKIISEIDSHLKKIVTKASEKNFRVIISSVFGNAEKMTDFTTDTSDNEPTNNPVPVIIIGSEYEGKTIGLSDPIGGDLSLLTPAGTLADLAPTILSMFSLPKADFMSGESLIDDIKD